jgi:hypothetical protein
VSRRAAHKETERFIQALRDAGLHVWDKRGGSTGYVVRTRDGRIVGAFGTNVSTTTRKNIIAQARHCGVIVDKSAVRQ